MGAAEPARAAGPRHRDLVLELAVQPVDVCAGHHVLQVGRKQFPPRRGDGVEGFGLLGKNVFPVRLLGMRGIDQNHSPVRRLAVRLQEQLAVHVVDHAIRIVADDRNNRPELGLALRQVADVQGVAVLPLAAFRNREDREPFVLGRLDSVETLRIRRVLIDQDVLGLRCADLVEIHLVVFVYRRLLLTLQWSGIAAVVETVAVPRHAGHFDPVDRVWQRLLGGKLHHLVLLPVRTAARDSVDGESGVPRRRERREPRRPVRRPGVGIDEHVRLAVHLLLDEEHALILEAFILPEEEVQAPCATARSISRSCSAR